MLHPDQTHKAPEPQPHTRGEIISLDHLADIRAFIEGCRRIETINDDLRELVESRWPDLVSKLPRKSAG